MIKWDRNSDFTQPSHLGCHVLVVFGFFGSHAHDRQVAEQIGLSPPCRKPGRQVLSQ